MQLGKKQVLTVVKIVDFGVYLGSDEKQVQQWMKRWPSGLNEDVRAIRRQNKERII